jgi:SAM-dependent methyltransferase
LERHRLVWLFLVTRSNLFDGKPKKMLHVAPEPCFQSRLKERLGEHYLTADLFSRKAMVKMDITDIDYPDQSFDVIYCSHVLEHVPDDRKAMREFHRTLKQDGWAILLVPITADKTFEDPSVTTPEERLRVYGQADHVRRYGPDYVDRLREAEFNVDIIKAKDLVPPEQAIQMGLTRTRDEICYCTRSRVSR